MIDRESFQDEKALSAALQGVDAIIHFAGCNRGSKSEVEAANPEIARQLVNGCRKAGALPAVVYANSTHSASDTPYGRSKRIAGEVLGSFVDHYTNLTLPHIFGECAKPFYNNVTATLIEKINRDETPDINPAGMVSLLHAGVAADIALRAVFEAEYGDITPEGRQMSVPDLYDKLLELSKLYRANVFPPLNDKFELQLFNCLRSGMFPIAYPARLQCHEDSRGVLFEAAKGGSGGQTFLSTTKPGITRGDHFHFNKVERFVVLKGQAVIRLRKVLSDDIHEFHVSGDEPVAVDMVPLYTHSLENVGSDDLHTMFWTNDMFDPQFPDTYADPVLAKP
jgi:UDP-2-acetamido-2,6-beta-L-arabino-hexul-4-ose reductase